MCIVLYWFVFIVCPQPNATTGSVMVPDEELYYNGQTVVINCDKGFRLVGNTTLTCNASGEWFGEFPQCIREGEQEFYFFQP